VSSSTGLAHAAIPAEPTSSTHFTASNNRLNMTGMEYDTAGNLSRYGNQRLYYDAEGRMKSVTDLSYNSMAQYVYDGDGRRVKKTWVPTGEITYYFYDALGQLAVEYSTQSPTSTGTSYLFTDMLGSVRTITNDNGDVIENNDYLPFGRMLSSADNGRSAVGFYPPAPDTSIDSSTPHKFTGKERDETGLDYFGARYYSGPQGRFTSPDPLLNSGRPTAPQSWNRYAYAFNNPLRFTDPTGLWNWDTNCDEASDSACKENRDRFRNAVTHLSESAEKSLKGSDERKRLEKILKRIGTENDGNRINVAFDNEMLDLGGTSPSGLKIKMTFNFGLLDDRLGQVDDMTRQAAFTALVGHEGTHAQDGSGWGMFRAMGWALSHGAKLNWERKAFTTEAYFFKAFNITEPLHTLWNTAWAEVDTVTQRENIRRAVETGVISLYGNDKDKQKLKE
jgi:RHS repeat-associated protein